MMIIKLCFFILALISLNQSATVSNTYNFDKSGCSDMELGKALMNIESNILMKSSGLNSSLHIIIPCNEVENLKINFEINQKESGITNNIDNWGYMISGAIEMGNDFTEDQFSQMFQDKFGDGKLALDTVTFEYQNNILSMTYNVVSSEILNSLDSSGMQFENEKYMYIIEQKVSSSVTPSDDLNEQNKSNEKINCLI